MVSVITPLYNNAATVLRAVNSVLAQTYGDLELIVVDNGSTDNGCELVSQVEDSRVVVALCNERGVSNARNHGIGLARGEWLAFLDADDEWMPTFLETAMEMSRKYPHCQVLSFSYIKSGTDGKTKEITLNRIPDGEDFQMNNYFEVAAVSDPPIWTGGVVVRRDAMLTVNGFPTGVYQGEDLLTWARLSTRYEIAYCTKPLSVFHVTEAQNGGFPRRVPPDDDIVGRELLSLYHDNPAVAGLDLYIAHWHEMRASIYLRLPGYTRQCRREIAISKQYNHKNKKLLYYDILSRIPYKARMSVVRLVYKS